MNADAEDIIDLITSELAIQPPNSGLLREIKAFIKEREVEFRVMSYYVDVAREALEVYAGPDFWTDVKEHTSAAKDMGKTAQHALRLTDPEAT